MRLLIFFPSKNIHFVLSFKLDTYFGIELLRRVIFFLNNKCNVSIFNWRVTAEFKSGEYIIYCGFFIDSGVFLILLK